MKKLVFGAIALILSAQPIVATCYKCEEIKEKNKNLPPLKYKYYDDYLEALKAEGKTTSGDIDFDDNTDDSEEKDNSSEGIAK